MANYYFCSFQFPVTEVVGRPVSPQYSFTGSLVTLLYFQQWNLKLQSTWLFMLPLYHIILVELECLSRFYFSSFLSDTLLSTKFIYISWLVFFPYGPRFWNFSQGHHEMTLQEDVVNFWVSLLLLFWARHTMAVLSHVSLYSSAQECLLLAILSYSVLLLNLMSSFYMHIKLNFLFISKFPVLENWIQKSGQNNLKGIFKWNHTQTLTCLINWLRHRVIKRQNEVDVQVKAECIKAFVILSFPKDITLAFLSTDDIIRYHYLV